MSENPSTPQTDPIMPSRELTLIVAATNKMGIGRGGTLPWTGLKKEMAYFQRVTKRANPGVCNAVIMGRKTWDSIPVRFRPLKDRHNIVITHSRSANGFDGATKVGSLDLAIEAAGEVRKAFVIGGAEIYNAALKSEQAKRILLTRVLSEFECDTFFPIPLAEEGEAGVGWRRKSKEELDGWVGEKVPEGVQDENGTRYVFEMWERVE